LKPNLESGLSYFRFKRSVPGAFNLDFIGSTCTALPWLIPFRPQVDRVLFPGLKFIYDELPSGFAFNFDLRRFKQANSNSKLVDAWVAKYRSDATFHDNVSWCLMARMVDGRGLHSSTSQLNLSRF
jgi:hypothetical protein